MEVLTLCPPFSSKLDSCADSRLHAGCQTASSWQQRSKQSRVCVLSYAHAAVSHVMRCNTCNILSHGASVSWLAYCSRHCTVQQSRQGVQEQRRCCAAPAGNAAAPPNTAGLTHHLSQVKKQIQSQESGLWQLQLRSAVFDMR